MVLNTTPVSLGIPDPQDAAETAGLTYVSDEEPGIRRKKAGTGFSYVTSQGAKVQDQKTLKRIRKLAIPPAWTDVWICAKPNGHLQATGRDARAENNIATTLPFAKYARARNTSTWWNLQIACRRSVGPSPST